MQLDFPYKQIEAYCRRWKITELAVFGSVLREDFRDVNLLVATSSQWSPSN